jgi:hypothetical protein
VRKENHNQINEFIPAGKCVNNVPNFMSKNLLVLSKIIPNNPWSFEKSDGELDITFEIKLEVIEYKTMGSGMNMNFSTAGYPKNREIMNFGLHSLDLNTGTTRGSGNKKYGAVSSEGIEKIKIFNRL